MKQDFSDGENKIKKMILPQQLTSIRNIKTQVHIGETAQCFSEIRLRGNVDYEHFCKENKTFIFHTSMECITHLYL